jgi:hypothetical protein
MKSLLSSYLLFFSFIFLTFLIQAQVSPDAAWYIRQSTGWDGSVGRHNLPINNQSFISGVKIPNRACNPAASHDLFVIYTNGKHYNTRNTAASARMKYDTISNIPTLPILHKQDQIAYMYLTGNYDVEPPPPTIKAPATLSGNNPSKINDIVTTNPIKTMTANHCVVPQKDITLIIKKFDSTKTYSVDLTNFFLKRNNVIVNTYTKVNSYKSSSAFNNGSSNDNFVLYGNSAEIDSSKLKFETVDSAFAYVNIKAVDVPTPLSLRISNFDPDKDTVFARFILSNEEGVIDTLDEPILDAFDPNYLHAISICKTATNRYANYKGHFHNTSLQPANALAFEFTLPTTLDPTAIRDWDIAVEGTSIPSTSYTVNITGRRVLVKLLQSLSCQSCVNSVPKSGEVDFSFNVLVDTNSSSIPDDALNLNLSDTKTYFFYATPNQHIYDLTFDDRSWIYSIKDEVEVQSIGNKTRMIETNCVDKELGPGQGRPTWAWIIGLLIISGLLLLGRKFFLKR